MIRLFVGLALPDALCETLAALHAPIPGARWVPRENLHLTLHFIGEVDTHTAADIDIALGRTGGRMVAPGGGRRGRRSLSAHFLARAGRVRLAHREQAGDGPVPQR